ncbi:MAG: carboxypeptidase regulatory-like domain-containing protein, partial [Blastocatellia bacterium]|nr:carboxypeptidase regulatory-like domain-containing protein [Blastocatellia bacterium]
MSIVLLILCDFTVHAQIYLGSLSGQVSDSTGATIVGATVTAIDTTTHFSTKAMTNSSGNYSIQFLTPGTYDITVEYIGFQPQTHKGIVLTAGGNVVTDITLKVGSASDMVTVNAVGVDALNTSSADIDVTFTAKEITDLPNIGRVPFELASLSAGTYDGSYMTAKASGGIVPWGNAGTAISASGVGGSHTIITLNGSIDAPRERITGTGGGYGGFVPSPESVQEVKVQLAMYDAEYGNSGGAAINTVLRSGTNDYHGAAYFIGRNTYLNANQSERVPNQNGAINPGAPTPRPNGTWNQPGGVLSGPVTIPHLYNGHDKTYFMVAYERAMLRTYNGASATGLVPTAAEAQGDFSALCPGGFNANGVCNPGGGVQIYDPLTSDASHNRTPFPYNQIPADRISPVGAALLKYFPAPNAVVSNVVNYIAPDPVIRQRYYSFVTRVDHTINENNKLNATFYKSVLNQQYPDMGFPQGIGPTNEGEAVYRNNAGGGLDYVRIFPNDWVLNARIGVLYHPFGVILPGLNIDLASLGINSAGLGYQSFPGLSFSDSYLGLQGATPLVPNTSQATSQISHDTNGSAAAIV